jgi:UrcA family protein
MPEGRKKLLDARVVGITIATATLLLAGAAPVMAQPDRTTASVKVTYSDLDLSSGAGAKILYQRIRHAAVEVCGGTPELRDLDRVAAYDQCRKVAVQAGVAKVNAPMLKAIANSGAKRVDIATR